MKKATILFVSLLLIFVSTPAFAYEDNPGTIIMDTVLARPVGLAAIVVGTAFFVVALPFTAASGSTAPTAQALIVEPFKYTFNRPLGDFSWRGRYGEDKKTQQPPSRGIDSSGQEQRESPNPGMSQQGS